MNNTVKSGGIILKGGNCPGGLFYEPTILVNVTQEMSASREEIFGPVAAVIKFDKEEEVIALANDCTRGLAGK